MMPGPSAELAFSTAAAAAQTWLTR